VLGSACFTAPAPAITDGNIATPDFALRRRLDGGLHDRHAGPRHDRHHAAGPCVTPRPFWPTFAPRPAKKLKLRIGLPFLRELMAGATWRLDAPSPFERCACSIPRPTVRCSTTRWRSAHRLPGAARHPHGRGLGRHDRLDARRPAGDLSRRRAAQASTWRPASAPMFRRRPGGRRLAADLITGQPTTVDPHPFRYQRLIDGTRLVPDSGI